MARMNLTIRAEDRLPDNSQWTNRIQIKSSSSNSLYIIAQNKGRRGWGCDCKGWIYHRSCKHLAALGLPAHEIPMEVTMHSMEPVIKNLTAEEYDEIQTTTGKRASFNAV